MKQLHRYNRQQRDRKQEVEIVFILLWKPYDLKSWIWIFQFFSSHATFLLYTVCTKTKHRLYFIYSTHVTIKILCENATLRNYKLASDNDVLLTALLSVNFTCREDFAWSYFIMNLTCKETTNIRQYVAKFTIRYVKNDRNAYI